MYTHVCIFAYIGIVYFSLVKRFGHIVYREVNPLFIPPSCHAHSADGSLPTVAEIGPTQAWHELRRAGYARETQAHFGFVAERGWVQGVQTCDPRGLPALGMASIPAIPVNVTFEPPLRTRRAKELVEFHLSKNRKARQQAEEARFLKPDATGEMRCSRVCANYRSSEHPSR